MSTFLDILWLENNHLMLYTRKDYSTKHSILCWHSYKYVVCFRSIEFTVQKCVIMLSYHWYKYIKCIWCRFVRESAFFRLIAYSFTFIQHMGITKQLSCTQAYHFTRRARFSRMLTTGHNVVEYAHCIPSANFVIRVTSFKFISTVWVTMWLLYVCFILF